MGIGFYIGPIFCALLGPYIASMSFRLTSNKIDRNSSGSQRRFTELTWTGFHWDCMETVGIVL